MTEELVEKVARGLHLSSGLVRDDMKTRLSLPYREMARAALASIQEDYAIVRKDRVNSEALAELIAMDADLISAAERTSQ